MREADDLTRRALMSGSLALAVTACRPFGQAAPTTEADPDLLTLRRVLSAEEDLLTRYDAVRRSHPALADTLDPIAADHRAHVRALRSRVTPPPRPSPSATRSTPGQGPRVPTDATEATQTLAELERTAAADRVDDLLAVPPFLAQVLASISASEATHAALLTGSP